MKTRNSHAHDFLNVMLVVVLIAILEIHFFRGLLHNPYSMIGDRGDARLNNLIMEHWYQVFCGKENASILNIFYPIQNTISYTDMLLGFSIPYSILRMCGMNMFLSNKIVLVGIHVLGSYSLFYLLKNIFRVKNMFALLGVVTFSFANGYYIRIGHTQMMAVSFLPLLCIWFTRFILEFECSWKRRFYSFAFLTGYALLAYTGWYTMYFFSLFCMILLISFVILMVRNRREDLTCIWKKMKDRWGELICYLAYFVGLLIPFLCSYLPTSQLFGKRSWDEIAMYLPDAIDIINVSPNNLLFGWLVEKLQLSQFRNRGTYGEAEVCQGFSIVLLTLCVVLICKLYKKYIYIKFTQRKFERKDIMLLSLTNAIVFSVILVMQSSGVSLWYFVYKIFPGASSLRALSRYYLFLLLPIGILVALLCEEYLSSVKKHHWLMPVVLICLWCSNIWTANISHWNYDTEIKLLSEVIPPPKGAEIMAIQDTSDNPQAEYIQQLDAWEIANSYSLKTINGYSGMSPLGWPLGDVSAGDYEQKVMEWRSNQNITEDIYVYDRDKKEWKVFK